jgi:glycerol-3-phosphate dehydrogenase
MSRRSAAIERMVGSELDVLVVGGGINGAVSALALASHGASVGMVDRSDFASGTSQESSNLVWGGFKYLEHYEVPLVFGLCRSRNKLADAYPTRIAETRFLATLDESSPYAPWFASLGAHAYWGLGLFRTDRPRLRRPADIAELEPIVDVTTARGGIEYSDCLLLDNDARFVSEMALGAADRGAAIANYVEVVAAERSHRGWRVSLRDRTTSRTFQLSAKVLVNAAGPRAAAVNSLSGCSTSARLVFSKGIHLIVPRLTESDRILAFYDDERRLFYVIPMGNRSVVGTTDTQVDEPSVEVEPADRAFLLEQVNKRLTLPAPLQESDIIAERCGVRALVLEAGEGVDDRDWTELSRRHAVEVDAASGVVSVLGGKLSDCLNVGAEVVEAAEACGIAMSRPRKAWYGEPDEDERARFLARAAAVGFDRPPQFDRAAATVAELLWRRYGRRADEVVALVESDRSLGEPLLRTGDFCRAEIMVAADAEWIVTMEDFLRRRTPLAQLNRDEDLRADPGVVEAGRILIGPRAVEEWLSDEPAATA